MIILLGAELRWRIWVAAAAVLAWLGAATQVI
jgi:hypothetical protein